MSFTEHNQNGVIYTTADHISAPHAFTTRFGGVSAGIYASLNLGENRGDDPDCVRENYRRLKAALGIDELVFSRQVHGTDVRRVTAADAREPFDPLPYEADGLVTDEPGLSLIIFVADCIPILFHDPIRGAVGAAHAGWRGTVADIAGITVRRMVSEFGSDPKHIRTAIGPGIAACCFETGPEVPEAVLNALGDEGTAFITPSRNPGKSMVDLKGVNRALLLRSGILPEHIAVSPACTMCHPDKYWSHRHTHGERGVQAAIITLKRSI